MQAITLTNRVISSQSREISAKSNAVGIARRVSLLPLPRLSGLIATQTHRRGPLCNAVNEADPSIEVLAEGEDGAPPAAVWRWEDSADAQRTYAVFLGVLLAGLIPALQTNKLADLPYFISLAVVTIYIGAHRGLNSKQRQQITLKQGFLAPIAASGAIFGTYLLLKYFPDISLQGFFDAYFWLLASIATVGAFAGPGRSLGSRIGLPSWKFSVPAWLGLVDEDTNEPISTANLALTDFVVAAAGIALATADLAAHHGNFTLNNAIACLVAADILQLLGLSSFRAAGVLLVGMLLYDVYWVFGSPSTIGDNVMLQVATSDILVGPTRLIFPRVPGSVGEAASFPFSLLGLGDVAVPGLLACLALRYDASRCVDMRSRGMAAAEAMASAMESLDPEATGDEIAAATGGAAEAAYDRIADLELEQRNRTQGSSVSGSFSTVYSVSDSVLYQRNYFGPVMVAYVGGLGLAFAVNAITGLGQPALLYLVPVMLGAVGLVAAARKDVDKLWAFKDTATASTYSLGAGDVEKNDE